MKKNRAVITAIGAVTSIGNTFNYGWNTLLYGKQSAGKLNNFNAQLYLTQKEINRLAPFIHYAAAALSQALSEAALGEINEPINIYIGSSRGGISTINESLKALYSGSTTRLSAYLMPATTISMAASYLAHKFKIRGRTLGISNACASGATAIAEALKAVTRAETEIAIAGGTEAPICDLCLKGYDACGVLSRKGATQPFDIYRDGFVLSEGACIIIIESLKHAKKRNAKKIYAEILGCGSIADNYDQTAPSSKSQALSINEALADAGIDYTKIDFISAHATGTKIGDKEEAHAINSVFKDKTLNIPVTAVKSMTGHILAASGAFEIACAAAALDSAILPKTANLNTIENGLNLNVITSNHRGEFNHALCNCFGFGGVNAVTVLKKYNDN
ncbi:beta-ketoacyl-acyl carrier protein synthase II [Candidatus Magnetoovum chiemensis]|nr:beta-ketoacyl-acyl carrier protein synthase II [Candidatus Magnetoovum chiemensis]